MECPLSPEVAAEREKCARLAEAMVLACEALKRSAKIPAGSDPAGDDWQSHAPHDLQLAVVSHQLSRLLGLSDAAAHKRCNSRRVEL